MSNPLERHRLDNVWRNMIARCTDETHKAYQWYGARGITVCQSWLDSFDQFLADMGKRPAGYQIERKDNDGNYEPSNCCWASRLEQATNKRPMGIGFFHTKTHPMRYIYRVKNRWQVRMRINRARICRSFANVDEAKDFRSNLEMEREMHRRLGLA